MRQLVNWFRHKRLEDSLDCELRYHIERGTNDFERTGLSAKEAHRQALLELGGVAQTQEEVRDPRVRRTASQETGNGCVCDRTCSRDQCRLRAQPRMPNNLDQSS